MSIYRPSKNWLTAAKPSTPHKLDLPSRLPQSSTSTMMRTTLKQSDTSQEEKQDSPENKDLPPRGQDDDL